MHVYMRQYIRIHMYMHVHTSLYLYEREREGLCWFVCGCKYIHVYVFTYMYMYLDFFTHKYTNYTQTCTHHEPSYIDAHTATNRIALQHNATQTHNKRGLEPVYFLHIRNRLTHCNKMRCTAAQCNTLQPHCNCSATTCNKLQQYNTDTQQERPGMSFFITYPKLTLTMQHTKTHCNTLQHTATHCSTLQHTATQCNTPSYPATHCNTLQHTAT